MVRANASEHLIPGIAISEGALEVSNVDVGDQLISRLQMLGEDFETDVEGWQVDRVRAELKTDRYFHGVYYPNAFQIDGRRYIHGLAALARRAGARIFEDTPVVSVDASGIRKRIVTPSARLRASHIVLAGNVHLGATLRRLSETLLPVWRYTAVTAPLGERLTEAITFKGSVADTDGIDHFRIVDGDRLMWASPETTWAARPERFAPAIARRIHKIFPQLGRPEIAEVWGGAEHRIGDRRGNRPGRRLFHRDVESRKFRRCRHVGPLPRTSADAGAYSRGAPGAGKPPSRNAANPPPPAGPATAAAAERRLGAALHPGHDTRNKVRKIPPDRCNFGRRAAYLKADHHFRVARRPS